MGLICLLKNNMNDNIRIQMKYTVYPNILYGFSKQSTMNRLWEGVWRQLADDTFAYRQENSPSHSSVKTKRLILDFRKKALPLCHLCGLKGPRWNIWTLRLLGKQNHQRSKLVSQNTPQPPPRGHKSLCIKLRRNYNFREAWWNKGWNRANLKQLQLKGNLKESVIHSLLLLNMPFTIHFFFFNSSSFLLCSCCLSHLLQHVEFLLYQKEGSTFVWQLFLEADDVYIFPDCKSKRRICNRWQIKMTAFSWSHDRKCFYFTCAHLLAAFLVLSYFLRCL